MATKIRHRGFNAADEQTGSSGLKTDNAMTVEECARLVVDAMNARKRDLVMTIKGKAGRFLKLVAPGFVDDLALAAVKDGVRPGFARAAWLQPALEPMLTSSRQYSV